MAAACVDPAQEEWGQLDPAQRTLYQEVMLMLETCRLLVSLGCPVPSPELVHQLEHGQELRMVEKDLSQSTCPGRSQDGDKRKTPEPGDLHETLAVDPWGDCCCGLSGSLEAMEPLTLWKIEVYEPGSVGSIPGLPISSSVAIKKLRSRVFA